MMRSYVLLRHRLALDGAPGSLGDGSRSLGEGLLGGGNGSLGDRHATTPYRQGE